MFKRQVTVDPNARMVRLGGRPPRVTFALLIAQLAIFLLFLFSDAPKWMVAHLALSADKALTHREIWQPFSALWIHLGLRSLIFDLAVLWLLGSALERWWGQKRFTIFFGVTGIAGLLVGMIAGLAQPATLMAGSQGAAMAMLLAGAFIFPNHLIHLRTLIPIKAHLVFLLLGAFILLGGVISGLWFDLAIQLGGVVAAFAFIGPRQRLAAWRVQRMKRKLHVVDGGRRDGDGRDRGPYLN